MQTFNKTAARLVGASLGLMMMAGAAIAQTPMGPPPMGPPPMGPPAMGPPPGGPPPMAMPVQRGMSETPCPPPAPPMMPSGMAEAMLKPGAKMPPMGGPGDPMLAGYLKKRMDDLARDWADVCHFKVDNARLAPGSVRTVFMGDSITAAWEMGDAGVFSAAVIDRGIGSQTTPQMVLRFYQDVIALRPKVVHIMTGTNDVAGNTGPTSPEDYKNGVRTMVDLAKANGVAVVLASIPPADRFPMGSQIQPQGQIRELNSWLRAYAAERGLVFVDYYSVLTSPTGGMKPELSNDGVHPNLDGYAVMRPLLDAALRRAGG